MSAHSMLTQAEFARVQSIHEAFAGRAPMAAHVDPDEMFWWEAIERRKKMPVPSGARRDWSRIMEEIG